MTALTVRLPDDKHRRLKALAQTRSTSINRLFDEMATLILAEFDAETRFQLRAERGRGPTEDRRCLKRLPTRNQSRNRKRVCAQRIDAQKAGHLPGLLVTS